MVFPNIGQTPYCEDRKSEEECTNYAQEGDCTNPQWENWMKTNCKRTCGHCPSEGKIQLFFWVILVFPRLGFGKHWVDWK